jgi:hypothetical protein
MTFVVVLTAVLSDGGYAKQPRESSRYTHPLAVNPTRNEVPP